MWGLLIERNLLFQRVLIGASLLPGLRGCHSIYAKIRAKAVRNRTVQNISIANLQSQISANQKKHPVAEIRSIAWGRSGSEIVQVKMTVLPDIERCFIHGSNLSVLYKQSKELTDEGW